MPRLKPITAIGYPVPTDGDLSSRIAPPYDVLDESGKAQLLGQSDENIAAVDLPHLPAKTVGPDEVYVKAGQKFSHWLATGVLQRRDMPALFAYRQTYTVPQPDGVARIFKRSGFFANVQVAAAESGSGPDGDAAGGVYEHEQTFGPAKLDRLNLMQATGAQLSPIFGLHNDPQGYVGGLLAPIQARCPSFYGTTAHDGVLHEVWTIEDAKLISALINAFENKYVFIADGHHRFNTAINYINELAKAKGPLAADHPARFCLFVLVSMQDPGMIVLPTHRVLGGMLEFSVRRLATASEGLLHIKPFAGTDLMALEAALPTSGYHAIGIYDPARPEAPLHIATTVEQDPLASGFSHRAAVWRGLDVAIVQHLIVEQVCQPTFCKPGKQAGGVQWRYPHTLGQLKATADHPDFQVGLIVQPTPVESVRKVSEAGELMPPKSTFFYPKLATGLVINPIS